MKNTMGSGNHFMWLLMLVFVLGTSACGRREMPAGLIGDWKSGEHKVTVRSEPEKGNYQFTSKTRVFTLSIHADQTASGSIGRASFNNAPIRRNFGNPEKTGVAYIIKCGTIGKIFMDDPLEQKEVEIWLAPLKEETLNAELRYTEGMSHFPMAVMVFRQVKIEAF